MGRIDLHAEVFDDLFELGRTDIPESGRLDAFVTHGGDIFEDGGEIFLGASAQRIQLD